MANAKFKFSTNYAPLGGTITLGFEGVTCAVSIPCTLDDIATALATIQLIASTSNVAVSGDPTFVAGVSVECVGKLANFPWDTMTIDASAANGAMTLAFSQGTTGTPTANIWSLSFSQNGQTFQIRDAVNSLLTATIGDGATADSILAAFAGDGMMTVLDANGSPTGAAQPFHIAFDVSLGERALTIINDTGEAASVVEESPYSPGTPTSATLSVWIHASGGTCSITGASTTVSGVAYNASGSDVATALSTATGLTVDFDSGSGTPADPWLFHYDAAGTQTAPTVDGSSLTGGITANSVDVLQAGQVIIKPSEVRDMSALILGLAVKPLMFRLVLATDGNSPATGLSPTVTISKNGGGFATPAGAVSEVGSGWYQVAANAGDRDTLGTLVLNATGAGAIGIPATWDVIADDGTMFQVGASSSTTVVKTNLTQADGFFNGALVEIVSGPLKGLTRKVSSYANTAGALTVDVALPSAPASGAWGRVIGRG